jgi:hypothetical protein
VFEVPQAVAALAPSTRKPRFRAAHLLLRFLRDQRSSHCTPPRGSGSGFSPISKFALTSGTRSRDCRSFILWIKHISLAIDNLFCVIGTLMQERPSASISLMACGSADRLMLANFRSLRYRLITPAHWLAAVTVTEPDRRPGAAAVLHAPAPHQDRECRKIRRRLCTSKSARLHSKAGPTLADDLAASDWRHHVCDLGHRLIPVCLGGLDNSTVVSSCFDRCQDTFLP